MTRRNLLKRLGLAAILIAIPIIALAPPLVYFGKEIRGRVVDADTGAPVEGVSIVAEWQIYVMVVQPHLDGRIKVIETTTQSNGDYLVHGWGPVVRPPWGALFKHSPTLTLFKSGYYPKSLLNNRDSDNMVRKSDFNGKMIQLKRFDGDFQALNSQFLSTDAWLTGCWRDCPQYVLALDAEAKRLRTMIPRGMFFAFPQELESMSAADREYFMSYRK